MHFSKLLVLTVAVFGATSAAYPGRTGTSIKYSEGTSSSDKKHPVRLDAYDSVHTAISTNFSVAQEPRQWYLQCWDLYQRWWMRPRPRMYMRRAGRPLRWLKNMREGKVVCQVNGWPWDALAYGTMLATRTLSRSDFYGVMELWRYRKLNFWITFGFHEYGYGFIK